MEFGTNGEDEQTDDSYATDNEWLMKRKERKPDDISVTLLFLSPTHAILLICFHLRFQFLKAEKHDGR